MHEIDHPHSHRHPIRRTSVYEIDYTRQRVDLLRAIANRDMTPYLLAQGNGGHRVVCNMPLDPSQCEDIRVLYEADLLDFGSDESLSCNDRGTAKLADWDGR